MSLIDITPGYTKQCAHYAYTVVVVRNQTEQTAGNPLSLKCIPGRRPGDAVASDLTGRGRLGHASCEKAESFDSTGCLSTPKKRQFSLSTNGKYTTNKESISLLAKYFPCLWLSYFLN